MRRYVTHTVIILFLLSSFKTYASPTDGTNMPHNGKYTTGYQNNIIFKHDLGDSYGNVRSDQHYYSLSYVIFDWLAIDGKIGFGNLKTKGGVHPKVEHNYGFAGGYGFRIRVLDDAKYNIRSVNGFQHATAHPLNCNLNGYNREVVYEDWQAS